MIQPSVRVAAARLRQSQGLKFPDFPKFYRVTIQLRDLQRRLLLVYACYTQFILIYRSVTENPESSDSITIQLREENHDTGTSVYDPFHKKRSYQETLFALNHNVSHYFNITTKEEY